MTDHGHSHSHPHDPADPGELGDLGQPLDRATDLSVPDAELKPHEVSRRQFLRGMGLLGVAVGVGGIAGPLVSPRPARAGTAEAEAGPRPYESHRPDPDRLRWLAGDHHMHTQYSSDARYRVADHVAHARRYGLDWMVITDHGRVAHEKVGIDRTFPDVVAARAASPDILVYQGLEWNIPGAEHGTVFLAPGRYEKDLLHAFERSFDGVVVYGSGATKSSPVQEAKAVEGVRWLADQVTAGRSAAALFLANHPARRGLDSPHEIRAWNDASRSIAVGMEGAPGHQAAGIARAAGGPEAARGYYDYAPGPESHAAYPLESYRTFGGFDWMTAKVGGLWDSLLAEGRPWWITANSDSHAVYLDTLVRGAGDGQFDNPTSPYFGAYGDPVDTGVPQSGNGDFWPGFYSRTVVGAEDRRYGSVMAAIAAGRMWVCHGDLIRSLDVRVTGDEQEGPEATFGGTALVRRGEDVEVEIRIRLNDEHNFGGLVPRLRRVDLIAGPITGPNPDTDAFSAPGARVVRSFEINRRSGMVEINHRFRHVDGPFYLRLRGTDGNASAPGSIEPRLDPLPIDPWSDLWFYTNPVFVQTVR